MSMMLIKFSDSNFQFKKLHKKLRGSDTHFVIDNVKDKGQVPA